ncbi:hypothetical protein VTN00DRAFT_6069 [Thermoascus crustaceus]|uniref:uncharacterized protein n=1 Tax=Thermoascus crustaceus TaxID=5088 RepID=UPI0037441776
MARVLSVHDENFQPLRLLSEKMPQETHERAVVYERRRVNGGPNVILKLRYHDRDIYPGGYLNALIMSKVPGCSIIELLLNEQEVAVIKEQLAETLEYFIGMSGLAEHPPDEEEPITVSSFASFAVASSANGRASLALQSRK